MRDQIQLKPEIYALVDKFIPPGLVEFLNTIIIKAPYIYLNYWTFVHFTAGFLFYKFFSKDFKLWIYINLIFEFAEYLMGNHPLFLEEGVDVFWDLVASLGGFWVAKKYNVKHTRLFK